MKITKGTLCLSLYRKSGKYDLLLVTGEPVEGKAPGGKKEWRVPTELVYTEYDSHRNKESLTLKEDLCLLVEGVTKKNRKEKIKEAIEALNKIITSIEEQKAFLEKARNTL